MFQTSSTIEDTARCLRVIGEGASVRGREALLRWLDGDLQAFLPHDVLLAAWGGFDEGTLDYHVLSRAPDAADQAAAEVLPFLLHKLHHLWHTAGRTPCRVNFGSIAALLSGDRHASSIFGGLARMKSALVHGLRDERGGQDCIYVLLDRDEIAAGRSEAAMAMLLPTLDTAARQVTDVPRQSSPMRAGVDAATAEAGDLSEREAEIMDWVAAGKTNSEIGSILGISAFTVKNHMQRIFRKLDVFNRAQAVSKITRVGLDG